MLEWYRAYLYFLLSYNNYHISSNLSPHHILRVAFIGMSWLKHVAIFRGWWDFEVWQDFKEMHIILIIVIIFVVTHSMYVGQLLFFHKHHFLSFDAVCAGS